MWKDKDLYNPTAPVSFILALIISFAAGFIGFGMTRLVDSRVYSMTISGLLILIIFAFSYWRLEVHSIKKLLRFDGKRALKNYLEGSFRAQILVVIKDLRNREKTHQNQVDILFKDLEIIVAIARLTNFSPTEVNTIINNGISKVESDLFGNVNVDPRSLAVFIDECGVINMYVGGKQYYNRN